MTLTLFAPVATAEFHADAEPVIVTGISIPTPEGAAGPTFSFASGAATKCGGGNFAATAAGGAFDPLAVQPVYVECKYGESEAPVTMNGCEYVFGGETNGAELADFEIACPSGKSIEIPMGSCKVKIGPQKGKAVHFTSTGEAGEGGPGTAQKDLDLHVKASGFSYSVSGFLCSMIINGELTLTANYTAKAFVDNGPAGQFNEGAQVGLWWT